MGLILKTKERTHTTDDTGEELLVLLEKISTTKIPISLSIQGKIKKNKISRADLKTKSYRSRFTSKGVQTRAQMNKGEDLKISTNLEVKAMGPTRPKKKRIIKQQVFITIRGISKGSIS